MVKMMWKKPQNMHYTDMCIYIDANVPNILEPGKNEDIENTIFNYLWLLVKALAIKKRMFQKFDDYDPFAFYAAERLFLALRKSYVNEGKIIKGKKISPIKSCLNYTKALLNPMKLEYQHIAYREIIDEEFVSKKFDSFTMQANMRSEVRNSTESIEQFEMLVEGVMKNIHNVLANILNDLPFSKNSLEYKYVKMSILMNAVHTLQTKNSLNAGSNASTVVWKLPKSMSSYISVIIKEFYSKIKSEVLDCYDASISDDRLIDKIISYREGSDYTYAE